MLTYGLNSCLTKAHFVAQIAAESSTGLKEAAKARTLKRATELWGERASIQELKKYTYVSIYKGNYIKSDGTTLTFEDRKNLLNYVYGKDLINLGNYLWTDGFTFRGRGFIQLTGRYNYQKFTDWNKKTFHENIDFTSNPDLITQAKYAARSAAFFWVTNNLDQLAKKGSDSKNVDLITGVVNPSMNGSSTRKIYFKKYWNKL